MTFAEWKAKQLALIEANRQMLYSWQEAKLSKLKKEQPDAKE